MLCTAGQVFGAEQAATLPETNLNQIQILPAAESVNGQGTITYQDGYEQQIDENFIGLIVNGSLIKDADCQRKEDDIWLPLRAVGEAFGLDVIWEKEENTVTLKGSDFETSFRIGLPCAQVNGSMVSLNYSPELIHDLTYLSQRDIEKVFLAETAYYNGIDSQVPHVFDRIPQIMLYRYPENMKTISSEEAVNIVGEKLSIACQTVFGEDSASFTEQSQKETMAIWEDIIENLQVKSENDRYYVVPVVYDFFVDKYTGAVYAYYNGQSMYVYEYDPYAPNALGFAG